jgi:hypothetical protein
MRQLAIECRYILILHELGTDRQAHRSNHWPGPSPERQAANGLAQVDRETIELPPSAARDKLRQPTTPAEIRQKLTPRYEFGKGMASTEAHTVRKLTDYRSGGDASMGLSAKWKAEFTMHTATSLLGRTTMEDYLAGRGPYVTVAMKQGARLAREVSHFSRVSRRRL